MMQTSELMAALSSGGVYEITKEMKEKLSDFYGGYATEQETAKTIHDLYEDTGYVIDTHTAVAASVYGKYKEQTKDMAKTVIASTASPYKFTRSVISAIDPAYDESTGDFELVDRLQALSGVKVPRAIEEIRKAPVLHDHICEKDQMKQTVMDFLGI